MNPFDRLRSLADERDLRPVDKKNGFACDCPLPHKARERHLFVYRRKDGARLDCSGGQGHEEEGIAGAFGLAIVDLRPPKASGEGCTLEAYAEAKRLPVAFLRSLGLSTTKYVGDDAVKIPHLDASGVEATVLFRTRVEPRALRWKKGLKAIPYGLDRLRDARAAGRVTVVEGQSDCHALWLHGEPALGLPGAGGWTDVVERALEGVDTIHVVIEPGDAAEALRDRLAKSRHRDRIRLLRLGADKDPCGLHVKDPAAFPAAWAVAIESAPRLVDELDQERAARIRSAREGCAALLPRPDLLREFESDVERLVVGETRNAKILLLALTSRVFARPVSLILKGPSSAGKSFLAASVLKFLPPDSYQEFTATSERAFVFDERPLKHRFVVLFEAAGMGGETAQYIMRSLLSEGCIRYLLTEKGPDGKHVTREVHREGPTGLLMTTTRTTIHQENETRHISLTVSDTKEQTRLVMMKIAEDGDGPPPPDFARALAALVTPAAVRLRRDFSAVHALVRAHALLHLGTRTRDAKGRVVATVADYAAVRGLVGEAIAEGVGATIPETLRETVAAVRELAGLETCSLAAVAERLGIDKSAASRRLRRASDQGHVVNDEAKKGHPAKWRLGLEVPEDFDVLPTAEELECAAHGDAWEAPDDPEPAAMKAERIRAFMDGETDDPTTMPPCRICGGTSFSVVGSGPPVCDRCHPGREVVANAR